VKQALVIVAACAGLAACGGDDEVSKDASRAPAEAASTQTAAGSRQRGVRIELMNTPKGRILVNANGQVIYLFTKEKSDRSRCYRACAQAWPPVLTKGKPRAGEGIDARLLGTTKRRGGGRIATYDDHPLYYYAHEKRRQVLCQGIAEFGGTWYVVAPSGDAILERFSVS
jgi:predicted lipoprotein with Yx(FWY)xxD motif